jgi:hypothetical protein
MTSGNLMFRAALAVAIVGLVPLAGCGEDPPTEPDGSSTMPQTTALETTPPEGPRVCDFVPETSVRTVLGLDDVDAQGSVNGEIADCKARPAGSSDPQLFVHVEDLVGSAREIFERDLDSTERNQLPDSIGLGYSWTDPEGFRATSTGPVSETWLLHGDKLVQVSLWSPPSGRDGEDDTTALAQQVVGTLDIPGEWTLDEQPPSR